VHHEAQRQKALHRHRHSQPARGGQEHVGHHVPKTHTYKQT
jgi:hypothetical protein